MSKRRLGGPGKTRGAFSVLGDDVSLTINASVRGNPDSSWQGRSVCALMETECQKQQKYARKARSIKQVSQTDNN